MPANNQTIAGMARSYNSKYSSVNIESHNGDISTLSRSIEDQEI